MQHTLDIEFGLLYIFSQHMPQRIRELDIDKLKDMLDSAPRKKREVQERLNIDRHTVSRMLNNKRKILGAELLTIADILEIDPRELALN